MQTAEGVFSFPSPSDSAKSAWLLHSGAALEGQRSRSFRRGPIARTPATFPFSRTRLRKLSGRKRCISRAIAGSSYTHQHYAKSTKLCMMINARASWSSATWHMRWRASWVLWIYDANAFEKGPVENVWRRRWKVITITLSVRIRAGRLVEWRLRNWCRRHNIPLCWAVTPCGVSINSHQKVKREKLLVPREEYWCNSDKSACIALFTLWSPLFASLHKLPVKTGPEKFPTGVFLKWDRKEVRKKVFFM